MSSYFGPPEERILFAALENVSKQCQIIETLVRTNRELSEALDVASRELKKLRQKETQDSNKSIA